MRKKLFMSLIVGVLSMTVAMPAFAAPKQMADGNMFDAEYYATSNPDVAIIFGTDENLLYSHYVNCGKNEGRKPYADGAVTPKFDAVYYATHNPDVVAVLGTDETILYNHYITCGKVEGRIPCENGTPFMEVESLETPVKQEVPVLAPGEVPNAFDYPRQMWHNMGTYGFYIDTYISPRVTQMRSDLHSQGIYSCGAHLNTSEDLWIWVAYTDPNDSELSKFLKKNSCNCTDASHNGLYPFRLGN